MLSEYAKYLENIRNSLMQCGVIFPQIDNIDSSDYEMLFHIGEKLNDVMYFYKIMFCSGNMEEMFLPLDKSYRGFVRMEAFNEFKEDILPSLKEMFGDEDESDNFNFGVLLDIEGIEEPEEEPEEWVNEDISNEDVIFGEDDLFGDDDDEDYSLPDLTDVVEQFESSGETLWGTKSSDELNFVSCGTDLFSRPITPVVDVPKEETKWVPKGTELFSVQLPDTTESISEDVWDYEFEELDDPISETEDVFTDNEDIWVEGSEDDIFESEDDVFTDNEDIWADESEDVWADESEYNDEDIWVDEPEEVAEDILDEDSSKSGISYNNEDIWADESEDVWVDEPEDDSEIFSDDEDVWVDEPEEEFSEEEVFSDDEDVWVDEPEDDDIWDESPKPVIKKPVQTQSSTPKMPVTPTSVPKEDRDIVDSMQEAASAALTSAKRFLLRLTKPEE